MIISFRVFKLLSYVVVFNVFGLQASMASSNLIKADRYACSDGKNYDLLRSYSGGWGQDSWTVVGLCSAGILSDSTYDNAGIILNMPQALHSEVLSCQSEDTPSLRKCMSEFIERNGEQGKGGLPSIRQGRRTSPVSDPIIIIDSFPTNNFSVE